VLCYVHEAELPFSRRAEAKARAGTDLVRKLLPLRLDGALHSPLSSLEDAHALQRSLFREEVAPYEAAVCGAAAAADAQLSDDEAVLKRQYAAGIYVTAVADLMATALMPALAAARAARFTAEARRADALAQLAQLLQARFSTLRASLCALPCVSMRTRL
jgi:BRCC36 C-terminal helical domain